jgi:membrane fusion protein, multidrug efflux system
MPTYRKKQSEPPGAGPIRSGYLEGNPVPHLSRAMNARTLDTAAPDRTDEVVGLVMSGGGARAKPTSRSRLEQAMHDLEGLKVLATFLTVVGVLCITAACGGQADTSQSGRPEVAVMTLQPKSITLTTEVPGHTSAFVKAEVRPQVSGTILRRDFEEGADVRAGQVLYQIDPLTYQVAYNSAKASLSLAEAIAARQPPRRRSGDLGATEQQDDDADAEYKWAQADVVKARAALDKARSDLVATRVRAPVSGRIGRSTVTSGEEVTAGQPTALAAISQIDPIYADITLSSIDVLHVMQERTSGEQQAGAAPVQVRLGLSDGSEYAYAGKLEFLEVPPDAGTGSVTVRAVFPNPEGQLLPGLSVRVQVQEGVRNQALLVPQRSVIRDTTGQASVVVVNSNSRVEVRPVTIECLVENQWLIGAGLEAGERIVVDGLQRVRPGITVTPVPSRANTPKAAAKPGGVVAATSGLHSTWEIRA